MELTGPSAALLAAQLGFHGIQEGILAKPHHEPSRIKLCPVHALQVWAVGHKGEIAQVCQSGDDNAHPGMLGHPDTDMLLTAPCSISRYISAICSIIMVRAFHPTGLPRMPLPAKWPFAIWGGHALLLSGNHSPVNSGSDLM